ncbi:sugar MFS transporter [Segetibacter aerophilus]|uniref:Glucose/galactose MFS transporter n=1 Tax=Segetibacter aerophilus TaxID=670293 RepID=A0A512BEC7_9BACT|nr:sugar MFS transporter [Segetibacter aerophilus]GEO10304.1 glucose/galactose MFS transporter [Segetibacter aerophilus]
MSNNTSKNNYGPMIIIGSLFFVFGFVTWVNSILIPYFKLTCELTVRESMLVAFAFYISYFVMAFPSSFILKKTGYKNGMMLGLFVMAAGALVFIPAANSRQYIIFLVGLFIEATGLTLLQTASNPYVTILGPIESAASRISIMGVCNKLAGAIAPLLLVGAIVKNPNEIDEIKAQLVNMSASQQDVVLNGLSARLITPYIIMAVVLVALGLLIKFTSLPDIHDENTEPGQPAKASLQEKSFFQHHHMIFGAIAIFCAVSVEVLAVDTIINYAQYTGLSFREAKYFATYTLLIMIISYIIGIFTIPKIISQRKALIASAGIGVVFTILAVIVKGPASVWFISLLGLGNALLWPAIWPLSLNGLGRSTSKGSALLIMGVVGGALGPVIYGAVSDSSNPQVAYWVLIPFYLFILYFATSGYKAGKQATPELQVAA